MKERSLAGRIVTAVLCVELVCGAGLSAVSLLHEYRSRTHALDVMLQGRSDSLLGAIQDAEDPADNVMIDPGELRLPPEDAYAVYNQGGALLGGANGSGGVLTSRAGDGYRSLKFHRHTYRVLEREAMRVIDRAENDGVGLKRPVTIVYAAPTTHLWHEVFEAAEFDVLVTFAIVLGTTVLLIVLIRKQLRPISELAVAASGVSASLAFTPASSALEVAELKPLAEALSTAISRLREALQVQQRFVGDAAHELKTAVAVVRSSIQVLSLRERSVSDYREGLDRLLADNERVEDLVSHMLELARAEEGEHPAFAPIHLTDTVGQAIDGLTMFSAANGIEVQAFLSEGIWVHFSQESARTLVSNLVVNAIQHSSKGGRVMVRAERTDSLRHEAILEVVDFGEGISEESLPHVFERFYRQDTSRSRNTGGAGLGLAICKSLVEAAGGTIRIESAPGRGTTVRVALLLA